MSRREQSRIYLKSFGRSEDHIFDEGTSNESLRVKFLSIDAELVQSCRTGGKQSALVRANNIQTDHSEILSKAQLLLAAGHPQRNLASILSRRFGISDRHIRNILKRGIPQKSGNEAT